MSAIKYFIIPIFLISFFSAFITNAQGYDVDKTDKKIVTLLQYIRYFYVEDVDDEKLVEDAIVELLEELDPHSRYISKDELQDATEPLEGNFDGIGIQFNILKDTIIVISPIPGGPSDKLGIQSGDKIVEIDGENATGDKIDNNYVRDHLRGERGTKVEVSIYRKNTKGLLDFTIIRDKIPLNSINVSYMVDEQIGYIKLDRFAKTSINEFHEALDKLKKEGMKSLILDLSGNSGGYLNIAIDLADEFLDEDQLIVYTEGEHSPKQKAISTDNGAFKTGKMIIMIDEGSASASEIVSGAVQDWDRGLIVGRRSFGKGLVQRPFTLPDESVVRLTTAKYYTPTGRSIQKPYDDGVEEYYADIYERYKHGEFLHKDSIHFPDSLKYYTPNGRVVYGGGGIMPDVFIAMDTTSIDKDYSSLIRKGLPNSFAIEYVNNNRKVLMKKYPAFESYVANFTFTDEIENDFYQYLENNKINVDSLNINKSFELMENHIKALIARNLWSYNEFFRIINQKDHTFLKAVAILKDNKYDEILHNE